MFTFCCILESLTNVSARYQAKTFDVGGSSCDGMRPIGNVVNAPADDAMLRVDYTTTSCGPCCCCMPFKMLGYVQDDWQQVHWMDLDPSRVIPQKAVEAVAPFLSMSRDAVGPVAVAVTMAAAAPSESVPTQLASLGALHDQGVLSDEEFKAAKNKVLGI